MNFTKLYSDIYKTLIRQISIKSENFMCIIWLKLYWKFSTSVYRARKLIQTQVRKNKEADIYIHGGFKRIALEVVLK